MQIVCPESLLDTRAFAAIAPVKWSNIIYVHGASVDCLAEFNRIYNSFAPSIACFSVHCLCAADRYLLNSSIVAAFLPVLPSIKWKLKRFGLHRAPSGVVHLRLDNFSSFFPSSRFLSCSRRISARPQRRRKLENFAVRT